MSIVYVQTVKAAQLASDTYIIFTYEENRILARTNKIVLKVIFKSKFSKMLY